MAQSTSDFLREALADAETVRNTAVANAKLQLEESLTPRIKEEIEKILSDDTVEEAHNPHKGQKPQDFAEVGEGINPGSSGIGTSDNKEPSSDAKNSSNAGNDGESSGNDEGKVERHDSLPGKDEEMKDAPKPGKNVAEDVELDDEDQLDEELDLRSIIAQLQAEVDALDGEDDELDLDGDEDGELDLDLDPAAAAAPEAPVAEPALDLDAGGDDEEEELDLEAILGEIEAELQEEEELELSQENARLKKENAELMEGVRILHSRLNEVNLLNAKLLFTNKLFRGRDLTVEQKRHVVETFDLATTLREVKLLYATLAEATIPSAPKGKVKKDTTKVVTEGIASTVVAGPSGKEVTEETVETPIVSEQARRWQQLAGIKVLND